MKKPWLAKAACAVGLSALCAMGMFACAPQDGSASNDSSAVAATVNGKEIKENDVTAYVEQVRSSLGKTEEKDWGEYLRDNSLTPQSVREQVIDSYVDRELVLAGADEKGIKIDSSEVDNYVNQMKQNYDSDEAWNNALKDAGLTEEQYRKEIEQQLKSKKFEETFASKDDPSEKEMLEYANMYATSYDGAKRSSHVLFETNDEKTAKDVLKRIKDGKISFEDAAKKYSKDTGSAEKGGDVGWDKTSSFVQEYTDALGKLKKGEMSGLVKSDYGYHIIKCTDVFKAPKKVKKLSQIPSDWVESIKSTLKQQKQDEAYKKWLEENKKKADIKINDMPNDLSYYVNMDDYPAKENTEDKAASSDAKASDDTKSSEKKSSGEKSESKSDSKSSDKKSDK